MKNSTIKWNLLLLFFAVSLVAVVSSCNDDDDPPPVNPIDPTATFSVGNIDGLTVTFVNASSNATSYNWDFDDGTTSTDENPTHTYAEAGVYQVELTALNDGGEDKAVVEVEVTKPGEVAAFIVGKDWQAMRGDYIAYGLGPQDDGWSWNTGLSPWFTWGDLDGATPLAIRKSLANDVYTFNEDGTYNVDFDGDFWGEYGIWAGTDYNEVDIDITGGSLPINSEGNDVSAFIAGTWDYTIDEVDLKLSVIGAGAHIMNPRYKNGESSYDVGEGIVYDIVHMAEGADADTLVLQLNTYDNDFMSEPKNYWILASYHGDVPPIKDADVWTPTDYADEVSSKDIWQTFAELNDFGSAVDSIETTYTVTAGVEIDGKVCTQLDRIAANGNDFQDYKFVSTDADIRFDVDGAYTAAKASVEVYMPSSNDYTSGLTNQVEVILADESGLDNGAEGGPGFWTDWELLTTKDALPTDQWVTITFDFSIPDGDTGMDMTDENAQHGIRDNIDLVILRLGGSGHGAGGTFYVRDFKFID